MTNHFQILQDNLSNLSPNDRGFAESLLASARSPRGASPKQHDWIKKLAERATKGTSDREVVDIGTMEGLIRIFDRAAQHLKVPAIVAQSPIGEIRLSVAGQNARRPGTINVVKRPPKPASYVPQWDREEQDSIWYGRIERDGKFELSPRVEKSESLIQYLAEFAKDPAKKAAEHGHLTGRCCFCNRALSDDRSTAVGYGPICADHFGLPWGSEKTNLAGMAA